MKTLLLTLVSSLILAGSAQANYSAQVFEQGSKKQKQLATLKVDITPKDGKEEVHAVYKDMSGTVLVDETALVEGSKLLRAEIDHKQLGQKGLIEVKDGKIFFSKTVDGKTTVEDEKLGDTFVSSANFQKFVKDNWDQVSKGKTVGFRYAVWDRQETVGFEIFKIGEEKSGEQPMTIIKMKPSSFVIAALVKPIIFAFAADGSRLMELNGRVPFKKKDGSSFKDLDAEVYYSY